MRAPRSYAADIERRWPSHIRVRSADFGKYNRCHEWSNNSDRSVLWLHMTMEIRTAARLQRNWLSFLQTSHASHCFFVAISTHSNDFLNPGTLGPPSLQTTHNSSSRHLNASTTLSAIADATFGNTNFAWSVTERYGTGRCFCPSPNGARQQTCRTRNKCQWPHCIDQWFVTAQVLGRHVALAQRIPMRDEDVIVHARPDVWWVAALDHAAFIEYARVHRTQLAFFFNFEYEGQPSDVAYVHTRGIMEKLCVDNFDTPAGPGHLPGCPMCYGTAVENFEHEQSTRQPWSCGTMASKLQLAADHRGALTGFFAEESGMGACISRIWKTKADSPCHFELNRVRKFWESRGCSPSPQRVCGRVNPLHAVRIAFHSPPAGSNGSSTSQISWVEDRQSMTGRSVKTACEHATWLNGAHHWGLHTRPLPITTPYGLARLYGSPFNSHVYVTDPLDLYSRSSGLFRKLFLAPYTSRQKIFF